MLLSTAYFESHLFVFLYHFYLNVDNILYPVFTLSPFQLNNDFILYRPNGICAFLCMCAYVFMCEIPQYRTCSDYIIRRLLCICWFSRALIVRMRGIWLWNAFIAESQEREKKKGKESRTLKILSTNALLLQQLVL